MTIDTSKPSLASSLPSSVESGWLEIHANCAKARVARERFKQDRRSLVELEVAIDVIENQVMPLTKQLTPGSELFASNEFVASMIPPDQLELEALRLSPLLKSARARSQLNDVSVSWQPIVQGFRFEGLNNQSNANRERSQTWLDADIRAAKRHSGIPQPTRQAPAPGHRQRSTICCPGAAVSAVPLDAIESEASPQAHAKGGRPSHGFTLVEVLVALGIVAIALTAGLQATGATTRHAQRQSDMLLAQLCAENALTQVRLSRQFPGVGDNQTDCEQAVRNLQVVLAVRPTPNGSFWRVDAQVQDGEVPIWRVSTVVGRY